MNKADAKHHEDAHMQQKYLVASSIEAWNLCIPHGCPVLLVTEEGARLQKTETCGHAFSMCDGLLAVVPVTIKEGVLALLASLTPMVKSYLPGTLEETVGDSNEPE